MRQGNISIRARIDVGRNAERFGQLDGVLVGKGVAGIIAGDQVAKGFKAVADVENFDRIANVSRRRALRQQGRYCHG
jgi:hypothetical protein